MYILGISAFYHDSAACLIVDGNIIAAAQEERFTRKKHDEGFPENAIQFCLKTAGIKSSQLDYVVFYEKPLLKFDRLMETYVGYAPQGFSSFKRALPMWLKKKLFLPREIDKGLNNEYSGPILFPEHHQSHAASAFYPSPFETAAILTIDGVGEWASTSIAIGDGRTLKMLKEIRFPHSLGLLYSAFTYYSGFKVNSGEYKLMGLAPYGEPKYVDKILQLIDIKDDGSYQLDMSYFNYAQGLTMTNNKFNDLFGGPPRKQESDATQRDMDIAASIQAVTETIMKKLATYALKLAGTKNLCMAGGVALNCVGNGKILQEIEGLDNLFIQPASGDAGGSLGAALFTWHQILAKPRVVNGTDDLQNGSLLGPSFTNDEVKIAIDSFQAKAHFYENEDQLADVVSEALANSKVVGLFNGRAEFGPRALGARSIIGDPRNPEMQKVMNLKIKFRESFRPFAPCVLAEDMDKYFDLRAPSPYMLLVGQVKDEIRLKLTPEQEGLFGVDKLNVARSTIPAITHVDYSARVQSVDNKRNPRLYRIMSQFKAKTDCSVIINTSFNVRGEPIVLSPEDAYKCFMFTHMDVLVVENYVLYKEEQPALKGAEQHLAEFKLD